MLIGGRDKDRITGSGGDDLLVSGYTTFDASPVALRSVLAEWSSGHTYGVRVANLTDGTGGAPFNGVIYLTPVNVRDEGAKDTLTGAAGTDWFLYDRDGLFGGTVDVADIVAGESFVDLRP